MQARRFSSTEHRRHGSDGNKLVSFFMCSLGIMMFFPSSAPSSICFSMIIQATNKSASVGKSSSENKNKNNVILFEIKIDFMLLLDLS
jgi:hypothetical protein